MDPKQHPAPIGPYLDPCQRCDGTGEVLFEGEGFFQTPQQKECPFCMGRAAVPTKEGWELLNFLYFMRYVQLDDLTELLVKLKYPDMPDDEEY